MKKTIEVFGVIRMARLRNGGTIAAQKITPEKEYLVKEYFDTPTTTEVELEFDECQFCGTEIPVGSRYCHICNITIR